MDNKPDNPSGNFGTRPFSVGVALREAREQLGLNVADVANRLKFAPRQIEALEEDNFARLPEIAFVRGFVRSYAKLLQLDPAPLLSALPHPPAATETPPVNTIKEVRFPGHDKSRKPNMIWLAAGVAVAIVLILFIWSSGGSQSSSHTKVEPVTLPGSTEQSESTDASALSEKSSGSPASTTPSKAALMGPPVPPSIKSASEAAKSIKETSKPGNESSKPAKETSSDASKQGAAIRLTFDQDSWVEITDKNGVFVMAQLNTSGSERWVKGSPPFTLTIGNASGVHLYYHGKPVDLTPFNRAEVAHLTLE